MESPSMQEGCKRNAVTPQPWRDGPRLAESKMPYSRGGPFMAEQKSTGDTLAPDSGEHVLLDFDHHREERHRAMQIWEREEAEDARRTGGVTASKSPARVLEIAAGKRSRTRT